MRVLTLALAALLALPGCFKPQIHDGDFRCGPDDPPCPDGFTYCHACDERCYSEPETGGTCAVDGGSVDAPMSLFDARPGQPDAKPRPDAREKPDARKGGGNDAHVSCPDGICEEGETCKSCPIDCGFCPMDGGFTEFCGDHACNNGETCSTCPLDCGTCVVMLGDGGIGTTPGGCDGGPCK